MIFGFERILKLYFFHHIILELFYQLLGKEKFDMVNNFLESEGINDLHGGNVGWNNKGELVLCDYSGYMG